MIDYILEILKSFLVFSETRPIIFTDTVFWVFFAIVYGVFTLIYKQFNLKNLFLFLVSIFFYYKTSGLFFGLLLFTITNDFFIAQWIEASNANFKRKLLLGWSVFINLGLLCYFKYAYFFTDSYNQIFHTQYEAFNILAHWANGFTNSQTFGIDRIILPVGISFYTFQTLSYTVDVFRKKLTPCKSFFDFGFYVSFFPQLVAGPIVRAKDFIPQIRQPFSLTKYQFGLAVFMILNGLMKKMVVGDYIAVNFIDKVYANPLLYTGMENMLAVLAYSLQVYLDFSGYTDIAIGIALLMGYRLNTNFNSPYKALNTAEFWKRWHISLSTWLQDYLYFPLGGNRKGTIASYIIISVLAVFISFMLNSVWIIWLLASLAFVLFALTLISKEIKKAVNTNINLMITMLLGGLWHGATLNFMIWGGLNGLGLMVYKFWRKISPYEKMKTLPVRFWKIFITFSFISLTRIFFRAEDMNQANEVIYKIWNDLDWTFLPKIVIGYKEVFLLMTIGFIVHWLPKKQKWEYKKFFIKSPVWFKVVVVVVSMILIQLTKSSEIKPFIYFQF
ncbi:MAG: MBOAT family O-acyltransferase [Bacteroidota bacterium]|nr:MBOAT family O-acyltransferase [Bacteroidota bacterium]